MFSMSKRMADVVIETLEAAGAKTCHGIVGDTLIRVAHSLARSEIEWVHVRHGEAGAFAASAEALIAGRLAACAASCCPGGHHFINDLCEANRNRAPVILIVTHIVRRDIGFEPIREIDSGELLNKSDALTGMGPDMWELVTENPR
jgi:pyruvate dehydrogenase (quinone)